MHIPTHQVHNVLNAYARRLKKKHDTANGMIAESPEDPVLSYSVEEKRRLIINKISANILKRPRPFRIRAPKRCPKSRRTPNRSADGRNPVSYSDKRRGKNLRNDESAGCRFFN